MEQEEQIGTFRVKTPQSYTRFEGEDRKDKQTYYGPGHENAKRQGGDLIRLSRRELDRFDKSGVKSRDMFDLVDEDKGGKWHNKPDRLDPNADDAVAPVGKIELFLAHNVDEIRTW